MNNKQHRLTNIDTTNRIALCEICDLVRIDPQQKRGKQYWRCHNKMLQYRHTIDYRREYEHKNRDKRAEKQRARRAANPEASRYKTQKWRKDNPEKAKKTQERSDDKLLTRYINAKSHPCTDCGIQYDWWIMQFDHIGVKTGDMCRIWRLSEKRFWAEIAQCELVCANCHADRTYKRRHVELNNVSNKID